MAVVPGQVWTVVGVPVEPVLRRLSAVTAVGAVLGVLVGGVGGRLAMMLLAGLNPQATGVISDDGFPIGRFTVAGTVNLLVLTTVIGVFGGGIYLVLRSLMIGPRWFQILSVAVGAAVVVASMLVHVGVDFVFLQPVELSIALFVAIPGLYAGLLTIVADRRMAPGMWFDTARRLPALAFLVLWLPLAPLLLVLAVGWFLWQLWKSPAGYRTPPLIPWLARLVLTIVFVTSTVILVSTSAVLI